MRVHRLGAVNGAAIVAGLSVGAVPAQATRVELFRCTEDGEGTHDTSEFSDCSEPAASDDEPDDGSGDGSGDGSDEPPGLPGADGTYGPYGPLTASARELT
jgi:hypothetical protein